jgi:ribose transport system substrate-binding protein
MKRMHRLLIPLTASAAALLMAACGAATPASSGGGDSHRPKIGVVALVATDALNAAVIKGVKDVASKNGWDVIVTDTNGDVNKANAAMVTFSTTQKTDAIAVMAFQSNALQQGLQAARTAKIPVVSWGGEPADGIVATTSARKVGEDSVNALLDDFGNAGAVLGLTYHTGVLCLYRGYAFEDAMKKESGIQLSENEVKIPGQVEDGTKFTAGWLAKHPKGSQPLAIWGSWDEPAIGAIAALKQAGRTDVKVYGINGGPQALQAVMDGTMTQVVWQDGETEGKDMMQGAIDAIDAGASWEPKTYDVPGVVVSQDNIKEFLAEHPDAMSNK